MTYTCIKCGSPLKLTSSCYYCGNNDQEIKKPKYRRSRPLIVFMSLSIITSIIWIILSLAVIFATSDEWMLLKIISGILLVTATFDLILAVFILRLKRWAFNIYMGLTVLNCIMRIISLDFFTALLRGGLTYLIFRHDYEHFN